MGPLSSILGPLRYPFTPSPYWLLRRFFLESLSRWRFSGRPNTQAINDKVYSSFASFGCGLRTSLKLIGIWTRPAYCGLLNKCYKPLATLWSDPAVFVGFVCFPNNMTPLTIFDMCCAFLWFLVNIWTSSCELRTSKLILVNRDAYWYRAYCFIDCLSSQHH